jgi:hypothetical protein
MRIFFYEIECTLYLLQFIIEINSHEIIEGKNTNDIGLWKC